MQISEFIATATAKLRESGSLSPRLDSLLLLERVLNVQRAYLLAHQDEVLSPSQLSELKEMVKLRISSFPMAYILKTKEFYGKDFVVSPDVLIPQPETESLVTWAIENIPNGSTVLEIGTGSGAVAVCIASIRPDLKVLATDISPEAIKVAKDNAKNHKVDIEFSCVDLIGQNSEFDYFVANLPYLETNRKITDEVKNQPDLALFGGDDGLDVYRRLYSVLKDLDNPPIGAIEHDRHQFEALKTIVSDTGFKLTRYDDFCSVVS